MYMFFIKQTKRTHTHVIMIFQEPLCPSILFGAGHRFLNFEANGTWSFSSKQTAQQLR